jgi:hypothetical protein
LYTRPLLFLEIQEYSSSEFLLNSYIVKNMANLTPSPLGPKKSTSPWVWVGLGCGTAALIAFGGIVTIGLMTQRAVQEFNKPINSKETIAKLGDIPIYQPSTFDEMGTKGSRLGTAFLPKEMLFTAAFDTSDPPDKVLDWYEHQFSNKGYRATSRQIIFKVLTQVDFQKDRTERITLQVQETGTKSRRKTSFVLMRMNYPAKLNRQ